MPTSRRMRAPPAPGVRQDRRVQIRLATRGSRLALAQSGMIADALRGLGADVELVPVKTLGDVSTAPLSSLGGVGVFVAAVREAVLAGTCDLAVHSLKDLPTTPADGLTLAAIPEREDPRDALCARDGLGLWGLPRGARVGTGSPRRAAQLRAVRTDLEVVDIRGHGLMIGIELDRPCSELVGLARDAGLLINVTSDSVVRLLPSLNITQADVNTLVERLAEVITRYLGK